MANSKCKECGCMCQKCIINDHDIHLHVEIENLKQKLLERENHIVMMETNFLNDANKFPNGEIGVLKDELLTWQDKYKRLYEAHRRVQRVNQGLEDKLLKLVDVCETDKNTLTKDVATLSHKLAEANYMIKKLTDDNERYKNDVSLAIQFLQCKQSNFVAKKFESLPHEVQCQVSSYMTIKKKPEEKRAPTEIKSIKVPIPTFPPTAMVYSVPKSPNTGTKVQEDVENPEVDIVSAAIMAKVLEERQRERASIKHCDTCTCSKNLQIIYNSTHHSIGTQTGDFKSVSCLHCDCNEYVQPTISGMKLIREPATNQLPRNVPMHNDFIENSNNIVKVQPNNFLINVNTQVLPQTQSYSINLSSEMTPGMNIKVEKNEENKQYQDIRFCSINEKIDKRYNKSSSLNVNKHADSSRNTETVTSSTISTTEHHHLCEQSSLLYEMESSNEEKGDSEKNIDKTSAKNASSDQLKGPRYCSMLLQSGTKNILLDNAHNNVAPVLYTRHHKLKFETPKTHNEKTQCIESLSSTDNSKNNSVVSEIIEQNDQRVAEWIRSTLDNDVSSSDNSRSESVKQVKSKSDLSMVDKVRYAEMEENVKRFLFGESEFLKTVEIGKLKYKNYRETENIGCAENLSSKSNSHTETEI